MAYASRAGRARTNPSAPEAFGVCDRCGIWTQWNRLRWQMDWRGASLQNLRLLVCERCEDVPQEQLRAIVVPADPLPIIQARVEPFEADETDYQTITVPPTIDPTTGLPIPSTTTLVTQDGQQLTTTPYGRPVGLEQAAVMPLQSVAGVPTEFGEAIPLLSVIADGSPTVQVTTARPHGLSTGNQITVEGLSDPLACGFYSVVVTTATAFTYQTYSTIPGDLGALTDDNGNVLTDMNGQPLFPVGVTPGSLLTPTSLMLTCLIGLPYGFATIPQVGP
jgi:hypothetical protein